MQTLSDYKLYTLTGLFFSHMVTFKVQPLFNKHQLHFFPQVFICLLKKYFIKPHTVTEDLDICYIPCIYF